MNYNTLLAIVFTHLLIAADAELELQRSSLVYLGKQYKLLQCIFRRFAAQSDV